jgi:formamidopyrimidine-DNA glycosylase
MPELPEVETIRGRLEKFMTGHVISDVLVKTPKIISGNTRNILGAKIINVRRFAKVLSIDLSNKYSIVIHIKLTGQLIYRGPNLKHPPSLSKKVINGVPGKHTHVTFHLDRGGTLYYNDVRKFGWIRVVKTQDVETIDFIKKLGPEPFVSVQGNPSKLTLVLFKEILRKSSRPVKIILMDQEKISGVGNIYANDALWLSHIHPQTSARKLSKVAMKALYEAIENVLKNGLKWGGASELSYVTPDGKEGSYQDHSLAYGKDGEMCGRCRKSSIKKIVVGGRGTYFCPVCQKR